MFNYLAYCCTVKSFIIFLCKMLIMSLSVKAFAWRQSLRHSGDIGCTDHLHKELSFKYIGKRSGDTGVGIKSRLYRVSYKSHFPVLSVQGMGVFWIL